MSQGRLSDAFAVLSRLGAFCATDVHYLTDLVRCTWSMRKDAQALDLCQSLVETFPDHATGWTLMGRILMAYGAKDHARAAFMHALELAPGNLPGILHLSEVSPLEQGSAHLAMLRNNADNPALPKRVRSNIHTAIGDAEDAVGNTEQAFHHWDMAMKAADGSFDPKPLAASLDRSAALRGNFAPCPLHDAASMPRMVLITGMPRSGTTLMERLLAAQDGFVGIGENRVLTMARRLIEKMSCDGRVLDMGWVERATPEQWAEIRSQVAQSLPAHEPGQILVSKLPGDCFNVPFARMLMPWLRVIHMERHPLDVGLSNFRTNFSEGVTFSNRLETLAQAMELTWRARDLNRGLLGDQMRVQSYRALIDDTERELKALLVFLDRPDLVPVLQPRTDGAVRTASVLQVREGINRKGLDKWRRYARQLKPLIRDLGGRRVIARWEAGDARGFQA